MPGRAASATSTPHRRPGPGAEGSRKCCDNGGLSGALQRCPDVTPPAYEASSYRRPKPTPHCNRHRHLLAASCPAAAIVQNADAQTAGDQRQRGQGAAGGRVEPPAAGSENGAATCGGANAGNEAAAGQTAADAQAQDQARRAGCQKAGRAACAGSAPRCSPATHGRGATRRAGAACAASTGKSGAANGHVRYGSGCPCKAARCRHTVARRNDGRTGCAAARR